MSIINKEEKIKWKVCGELFGLDMRLHDLCYTYESDDSDHFAMIEEELLEIEKEVDKLTKLK